MLDFSSEPSNYVMSYAYSSSVKKGSSPGATTKKRKLARLKH